MAGRARWTRVSGAPVLPRHESPSPLPHMRPSLLGSAAGYGLHKRQLSVITVRLSIVGVGGTLSTFTLQLLCLFQLRLCHSSV